MTRLLALLEEALGFCVVLLGLCIIRGAVVDRFFQPHLCISLVPHAQIALARHHLVVLVEPRLALLGGQEEL